MSDRADGWVTQIEAANLLGVHRSLIPKMLRRGDLVARKQRPSLRLADVLELRDARAEAARMRNLPPAPKEPVRPPDDRHEWVRAKAVAEFMGVQVSAVHQRARRGRLPYATGPDGTKWFQLHQVAMTLRATQAQRSRSLDPAG